MTQKSEVTNVMQTSCPTDFKLKAAALVLDERILRMSANADLGRTALRYWLNSCVKSAKVQRQPGIKTITPEHEQILQL